MNHRVNKGVYLLAIMLMIAIRGAAQADTRVSARMDATQITIGDQARIFLEVHHNPADGKLQWATIADTFNTLEITEKGKIDTIKEGNKITYRQQLRVTGFDSGIYKVPPYQFIIISQSGTPSVLSTDSFMLSVNTVQVDTTKAFRPIKNIIFVDSSWKEYLPYIVAGVIFLALLVFVIVYFLRNRSVATPKPAPPAEPLNDRMLRLLGELDKKELWQKDQVKEYYVELTDIVRSYIEERYRTPALELTTDELLDKAKVHKELRQYHDILAVILRTADLAKFAKGKPLPQEHFDAMDNARKFIESSRPVITVTPSTDK